MCGGRELEATRGAASKVGRLTSTWGGRGGSQEGTGRRGGAGIGGRARQPEMKKEGRGGVLRASELNSSGKEGDGRVAKPEGGSETAGEHRRRHGCGGQRRLGFHEIGRAHV